MTAIEYIQSLEKKVDELEALLGNDASRTVKEESTPPTSPERNNRPPPKLHHSPSSRSTWTEDIPSVTTMVSSQKSSVNGSDEDVIETMVGADETSPLDTGSSEAHRGSFAGLSLLQRMENLCKDVIASKKQSDAEALQHDFVSAFDVTTEEPDSTIPPFAYELLPPRSNFTHAIDVVMTQACCNMQFLDQPMLEQIAAEVYGDANVSNSVQSRKSFALLYAVLALGRRFDPASLGDVETAQTTRG